MVIKGNNPAHSLDARYFEYQYRTPGFIQQRDHYSKGVTDFRKRLYWYGFKQLVTLVPPVEEQRAIIEFIEQATLKQNAAVALLEQQLTKLKEYKATLINSAVTGKLKVPGVVEPGTADMEVA
jgi:type I restriction enzyme S subunit